jgi:branched-chain amino acid transport system substrate-binding protein
MGLMKSFFWIIACSAVSGFLQLSAAIQIGAVYSNSGDQAALDEPSWRGAQLAVAEVNKAGGIHGQQVELIHIRGNSTSADIQKNVDQAVKNLSLVGLVGLSDSDLAYVAGREAIKAGIPFVTSGATSPRLPSVVGSGLYLACFGDNMQAATGAEWLLKAKGSQTAAILFDPRFTYTRLLKSYFSKAFRRGGGKITTQLAYKPGKPMLLTPAILKADAVFLSVESSDDAMPVIRQLRAAGYPGPIVGGDSYDTPYAWINNPYAQGVYYTTHAFPATCSGSASQADSKTFSRNYKRTYHCNPDAFSALGYDATRVLLRAIENSGNPNGKNIRSVLASGVQFTGLTGPITLSKTDRIPQKPVALVDASAPNNRKLQVIPSIVPKP